MSKLIKREQLKDFVFDGMSIMVGGFMAVGTPENLMDELVKINVKDLTIICNDAGFVDKGVGKLISNGQVSKLIASHIGLNPMAGQLMSEGKLDVDLRPQGTMAEQIRAGGAGLGGILTPTGLGTIVEKDKKIISLEGKRYILEPALKADLALLYGAEVDNLGNTVYSKTTRNFNPVMATATKHVIVLARKLVNEINPDHVLTPHIFIDNIIEEVQ
ncbi:Butyrate--acetoacetate CoA-transferase subunit A [Candidatus Izimaplasma bacterium HR1]|jgi:acetate CoA/acetoacetate CoA-transferase alpha subunit|uniref:CoA transferase subunit A n=1 Tax=Candidatus Izimoplasma sp. HR1 TaxID=1541959 RepID=UPI0004F62424|nr:Butyrate--acetoacetate CoA-transferase subunit A [Candidatus Izimaplasma bacterium HR1]